MKKVFTYFLFALIVNSPLLAQDTIFVNKHSFPSPVKNVFNVGREVYLKTSESLFLLEDEQWVKQKIQFEKPYVFFNEDFYESDFIPNSKLFDASGIKEIIPQKGLFISTSATKDSRFFVASGSALFEYEIFDHYTKSYYNKSIRDIFIDDRVKVISTYSGIFVNDTLLLKEPGYSNGPLSKINGQYYLCSDLLYQFFPPDSVIAKDFATNISAGHIRNLVEWRSKIYSQNTQSINLVAEDFNLTAIHRGEEYLDLIAIKEGLIFSTSSGKCYLWNGENSKELINLDSKIRDLYPFENFLYIATDNGVYTLEDLNPSSLKKVFDTRFNVHIEKDNLGNTWIATENGLYVKSNEFPELVQVIYGVEFNREAFEIHEDLIYAGAVDGLYIINFVEATKSFIPAAINKLKVDSSISKQYYLIALPILLLVSLIVFLIIKSQNKKRHFKVETRESKIDLIELEKLIIQHKLNSVEVIANHLNTNTVQLNRNFRDFNITPGKFLKNVKLKLAKQLLKEGKSLDEVADAIGYSRRFLRKELEG